MKAKRYLIAAVLLLICLFSISTVAYAADIAQEKKIVYVVLDDSGSMDSRVRWSHANYAVQVLGGLLNPDDTMKLYYLNAAGSPTVVDLSSQNIQSSLNKIANRSDPSGGTPFSTVNKAFNAISRETSQEGCSYWLVVITDGLFENGSMKASAVRNEFINYVNQGIGNGKQPLQMIFCTIGNESESRIRIDYDSSTRIQLNEKGIYCYHGGEDKIIDVMEEIADRISGRSRFTGVDLKQKDKRTVQVKSDIPLFNFVVFAQGNNAKLQSAAYENGGGLSISRQAVVQSPRSQFGDVLSAGVFTVDAGNDRIRAGTYTLSFDGSVDVDDVVVLFEPAVDVRISGPSADNLHVGETYSASAEIYEYGTQNLISLKQLPEGSKLTLKAENGSKLEQDSGSAPKITLSQLENSKVKVTATLQIPGYRDIVKTFSFDPVPEPVVKAAVDDNKKNDLLNRVLTVTTEELKREEKYIDFQISATGLSLKTAADLEELGLEIETSISHRIEYRANGVLRLYPQYTEKMKLGDYNVKLYTKNRKKLLETCTVKVIESTFAVEVSPKNGRKIKEAEFREKAQTFTFTLYVDGKKADASQYAALQFTELYAGNPVTAVLEDGKWTVTAGYQQGMKLGTYNVYASLNGARLKDKNDSGKDAAAVLTLEASKYEVSVEPAEITKKQSELETARDLTFRIKLEEDGKKIAAEKVQIDWGTFPSGSAARDPEKENELIVTLGGDITVPAGDYPITVSYTSACGTRGEAVMTMHVLASEYLITLDPDRQMIFNTVADLQQNADAFRFDITVDGRALTAAEMQKVTSVQVSPQDTATTVQTEGSGYRVLPKAGDGWQPTGKEVSYKISCTAGNQTKEALFRYHYVNYEVKCEGGSGADIITTELKENQQSLFFRVYGDGKQLSGAEVKGNYTCAVSPNYARHVDVDVTVENDGTIVVTPTDHSWKLLYLFKRIFIPAGEMEITVSFKTGADSGVMDVYRGGIIELILPYLILATIIFLIVGYVIKKRFYGKSYLYYQECYVQGSRIKNQYPEMPEWSSKKLKNGLQLIIPYVASKKRVQGLQVRGGSSGSKANRQRGIEFRVGSNDVMYQIIEETEVSRSVYVRNPGADGFPKLQKGWHWLGDGQVLAVLQDDMVTVFKYHSEYQ